MPRTEHPSKPLSKYATVPETTVIRCFAKINLYLDVICKRPDGYHNIETIFQTISISDVLRLQLVPSGIEIICDDPAIPRDESNLACKAFLAIREATGYDQGIRITIEKNIPSGAGLGGGSSDAAATLIAINQMLQAGLSEEHLRRLARDLGADVPFFLTGGLAAAWGIGDQAMALPPSPENSVVVAIPHNLSVSTADAYGMLQAPPCENYNPGDISECTDNLKSRAEALSVGIPLSQIESSEHLLYNSLEKPIFSRYPEIEQLKALMFKAGAKKALMTGSGSAVYGVVESKADAIRIKDTLEHMSTCECFIAKTLNRSIENPDAQ